MNIVALGMMSGTSLDGVDLALCRFTRENNKWEYELIEATSNNYSEEWEQKLRMAHTLNAHDFLLLHNEYGRYIGSLINEFIQRKQKPELIATHGHTIFHEPSRKLTCQIGNGASIAATTGITTVSDFRNFDVAFEGQGAPLVPIGDKLLFRDYDYCINLGGFANISLEQNDQRIAWDLCPVNIVLNALALKKNKLFDKSGEIGASGKVNHLLLNLINSLEYYQQKPPKSLGREWVEKNIWPLLNDSGLSVEDQAATFYEHISHQISKAVEREGRILLTGGGTYNDFLINKLKEKIHGNIIIPENNLIDFKEALIFAFLGVLSYFGEINCLSSVTGAKQDTIAGIIHYVGKKSFLQF